MISRKQQENSINPALSQKLKDVEISRTSTRARSSTGTFAHAVWMEGLQRYLLPADFTGR
jgi:hypothetical protein